LDWKLKWLPSLVLRVDYRQQNAILGFHPMHKLPSGANPQVVGPGDHSSGKI